MPISQNGNLQQTEDAESTLLTPPLGEGSSLTLLPSSEGLKTGICDSSPITPISPQPVYPRTYLQDQTTPSPSLLEARTDSQIVSSQLMSEGESSSRSATPAHMVRKDLSQQDESLQVSPRMERLNGVTDGFLNAVDASHIAETNAASLPVVSQSTPETEIEEKDTTRKTVGDRPQEFTKQDDALPLHVISATATEGVKPVKDTALNLRLRTQSTQEPMSSEDDHQSMPTTAGQQNGRMAKEKENAIAEQQRPQRRRPAALSIDASGSNSNGHLIEASMATPRIRPAPAARALSTPITVKRPPPSAQETRKSRVSSKSDQHQSKTNLPPTISNTSTISTIPSNSSAGGGSLPSPVSLPHSPPTSAAPVSVPMPLPPLSLPTYLQLELSSHRPSPMFIQRSETIDFPYESSRVKIERLLNFLLLPHQLEGVLWFGALACLDSWLYTFTILPLRLLKSLYILIKSWIVKSIHEVRFVSAFVYSGSQRMWHRRRTRGLSSAPTMKPSPVVLSRTNSEIHPATVDTENDKDNDRNPDREKEREREKEKEKNTGSRPRARSGRHHQRTKSVPSNLLPHDKADILKGLLIISTTLLLLRLDASRMYHWVRGQATIKLYVIYNVLEVCDRLLSAIGQDVLECLFSQEALERKPDGHSKVLRPFWLFILALFYNVVHSTALFYQVITLNVAVNSYNNALVTLLMSNQFVEIKSTVFKKFEKENLFQLTCADIVERFQLWHMLLIIASRNIVETGGLTLGIGTLASPSPTSTTATGMDRTQAVPPRAATAILPSSFMIVPSMVSSLSTYMPQVGHVLGPFIIVLGSEMLIDWLKHAYINKFNNTRPVIYGRFLDLLAKDYYTNAFGDQNLTKRLGLPVIPLSCLMIRAGFQTYQMFVSSWVPLTSSRTSDSLASIHEHYSAVRAVPTSTAGLIVRRMDDLLSQLPATVANSQVASYMTTALVLLLMFLVLLVCKLLLGMTLLAFARARYRSMHEREHNASHHIEGGRRVGGWGIVEVDEDKRRWIYDDDPVGARALKEREAKEKAKKEHEKESGSGLEGLDKVKRYEMAAKRIW